jgi:hypothetical protein
MPDRETGPHRNRKRATNGNVGLHERYVVAWSRISLSIDQGFHFEAIAIEESIMSNRLKSFLYGTDPTTQKEVDENKYVPFGTLIRRLGKQSDSFPDVASLNEWCKRRNSALHALAQSSPSKQPEKDVATFLEEAKVTAVDGARLARKVSDWHRRTLRAAKKTARIR